MRLLIHFSEKLTFYQFFTAHDPKKLQLLLKLMGASLLLVTETHWWPVVERC